MAPLLLFLAEPPHCLLELLLQVHALRVSAEVPRLRYVLGQVCFLLLELLLEVGYAGVK
jgi:hypothetical protein